MGGRPRNRRRSRTAARLRAAGASFLRLAQRLKPRRKKKAKGEKGAEAKRPARTASDPNGPRGLDLLLLTAVFAVVGMGIAMVYSSSAVYAQVKLGDGAFYLKRHLAYAALGTIALYVGWRIDYRRYRPFVYPLLVGSLLLLAALLVPGIGTRIDGAVRWFRFAGLSFQPSELAKVTLVFYLAYSLSKKREEMRTFSIGFLPHLFVAGVFSVLVLKQPDLGTTAILMAVTFLLLFVAGTKISYMLMALLAAAPIVYYQIVGTPWRLRRLIAFLDPWAYRNDAGYQMAESLMSVGSGGLWGLGLGGGKQKLFFLPAAHTDFIFAITGEELGFVGLTILIVLFALIALRGVRAAFGASDLFGTYVAFGITATLTLQALFHMAVVLGLVPTKGITLPLFSSGGTGLIMNLFSVGVLLNIAARNPAPLMAPRAVRRKRSTNNRRKASRVVVAGVEGEASSA